jgi:hypothetical protein
LTRSQRVPDVAVYPDGGEGGERPVGDVRRFQVWPHYHQVEVSDAADDVDYPQWETGAEQVLVSAQCIVLATRSDLKGDVEIEVRLGTSREEVAVGALLFDGELLTTGQGIKVGNSLTDLHHIPLPIGWHPVRIYADPPTDPARFTVLVDRRPANPLPVHEDDRATPDRWPFPA